MSRINRSQKLLEMEVGDVIIVRCEPLERRAMTHKLRMAMHNLRFRKNRSIQFVFGIDAAGVRVERVADQLFDHADDEQRKKWGPHE